MPRDGSNIYHIPPGTQGTPDTTVASAPYNVFLADIGQDQNLPRPIVAGGTGATNAIDAMTALGGEIAAQQVTNYDSFPFANGSFYSQPGATSQPVNSNVSGYAVIIANNPAYINLVAVDNATGTSYTRQKTAGTWGAWALATGTVSAPAGTPAQFTLAAPAGQGSFIWGTTGGLQRWLIQMGNGGTETAPATGNDFYIHRYNNDGSYGGQSMHIERANSSTSFGGQVHSSRFSYTINAGCSISFDGTNSIISAGPGGGVYVQDSASSVNWLSVVGGNATISGALSTGGATTIGGQLTVNADIYANSGVIRFINNSSKYLYHDGTNFTFSGGDVFGNAFHAGTMYLNGSNYAITDGSNYILRSGGGEYFQRSDGYTRGYINDSGLNLTGNISMTGNVNCNAVISAGPLITSSNVQCNGAIYFNYPTNNRYLNWDGTNYGFNGAHVYSAAGRLIGTGDNPALNGQDCSHPNVVATNRVYGGGGYILRQGLSGGYGTSCFNFWWDGANMSGWVDNSAIGFVQPSDYRIKKDVIDLPGMWDTVKGLRPIKYSHREFSPPSHLEHHKDTKKEDFKPLFKNSDEERWGFIAHDLQRQLTKSAATGVKDAPNIIQTPEAFTIIAALTKALQEAMARIEALEAR